MEDPELEILRQQRRNQLEAQFKNDESRPNANAHEEQVKVQQEAKNTLLSQIMDQAARARLNTLMLGKPEKGRMVEAMLIRMTQTGQINGKIGESELIGLLETVNRQMGTTQTKIKFDRRRAALDSDDEI